jgi:SAM-dependent methyltransferase
MSRIDFGRTAVDYSVHRAGFPPQFFDAVVDLRIAGPGGRVLDLGTGTGTVAVGLRDKGCLAIGLDISEKMIGQARTMHTGIDFLVARAEAIPLQDASIAAVFAGQCWHWFQRELAAQETYRVLAPDGYIAIAHFDWIPVPGNIVDSTESLIMAFNPQWGMAGGNGLHPEWFAPLAAARFRNLRSFSFDLDVPYTHSGWRGRIRASAGVGASLPAEKVDKFDEELGRILQVDFSEEPLQVPHRVWCVYGQK